MQSSEFGDLLKVLPDHKPVGHELLSSPYWATGCSTLCSYFWPWWLCWHYSFLSMEIPFPHFFTEWTFPCFQILAHELRPSWLEAVITPNFGLPLSARGHTSPWTRVHESGSPLGLSSWQTGLSPAFRGPAHWLAESRCQEVFSEWTHKWLDDWVLLSQLLPIELDTCSESLRFSFRWLIPPPPSPFL